MSDEPRYRAYDHEADQEAAHQILREVGWLTEEPAIQQANDTWLELSHARVAELRGAPESLAAAVDGDMRYLDGTLPLSAVVAVVTSRLARRMGLGTRLTAQVVADAAARGAAVAVLGVFDLGFYDRLGFGSGGPERLLAFDPGDLRVGRPSRPPVRLSADDWERMHGSRLARRRIHGAASGV